LFHQCVHLVRRALLLNLESAHLAEDKAEVAHKVTQGLRLHLVPRRVQAQTQAPAQTQAQELPDHLLPLHPLGNPQVQQYLMWPELLVAQLELLAMLPTLQLEPPEIL
jgi:hypothetical protein